MVITGGPRIVTGESPLTIKEIAGLDQVLPRSRYRRKWRTWKPNPLEEKLPGGCQMQRKEPCLI